MVLCTSVHVPNRISHRTFTSLRPFGQYQGEKGLMAYRGPEGFQSDLKALGKVFGSGESVGVVGGWPFMPLGLKTM